MALTPPPSATPPAPAPQEIGAVQKMAAEASGDMWPWKHWEKRHVTTVCPDERGWEWRPIDRLPFGMVIFHGPAVKLSMSCWYLVTRCPNPNITRL